MRKGIRKFTNLRAALNYIRRLRELYGRKAKCSTRTQAMDEVYVIYTVPSDGKELPDAGQVVNP